MSFTLGHEAKIYEAIDVTTAGTGDVNGNVIDTQGGKSVLWIAKFTVANAGNTLKAQQGQQANLSDAADLAGSQVTVVSEDIVALEIIKPRERYVRPVAVRGVSTAIEWAVAILHGGRTRGANIQPAAVAYERHVSPAEGTA